MRTGPMDPGMTFDVVVVGSGFGGAVTTYRQAEAGRTVCLLERGRAYPPGSFPRRPSEVSRSLWDPSEGLRGLFDVWSFRRLDALVASGLGGGSLIYANVLLRKDEKWFNRPLPDGAYESWPVSRADLDPEYDRVEEMLTPMPFPDAFTGVTAKAAALARAAGKTGMAYQRLPLAITFGERDRVGVTFDDGAANYHGVPRQSCNSCGGCNLGCNSGSKNTLDLTYLSRVDRSHADIRPGSEVRSFRPVDGGWEVTYVRPDEAGDADGAGPKPSRPLPRHHIRCRQLVLSAGALGSTFLLLRNRAALPRVSDRLGHAFSGNGDFLGFFTRAPDRLDPSIGPVITGAVRVPDQADGGDGPGMYLEDGGYHELLDWLNELLPPVDLGRRVARLARARLSQALRGPGPTRISHEVAQLVGDAHQSTGRLPLLAMGRDCPDGLLRLRDGLLDLDTGPGSAAYYRCVEDQLRRLAGALGARYRPGLTALLSRLITVHPLGGAAMASSARDGVVDSHGEVFGHPGLFVVDGAIMPGPVGPNPALTIAAMAERCSRQMIERAAA
jgi:cholesterol oxidase